MEEVFELRKLRKMSIFAWTVVLLIAIFAVSIAATVYYYYGIPHPAHLRVLYTHPHQMVSEVTNDFKEWYQQKYGRPIDVTLTPTSPQSAFETVTTGYIEPEADIWWGGPVSLFEEAGNSLLSYNSTQKNENLTCGSCPLMDLRGSTPKWYAASLYGLGIMYNEYALNSLDLQVPQSWNDFLRQEYEGNITMVDPARSEFSQPFIMLIIQSRMYTDKGVQNWARGWEFLVNFSAFVKEYDTSETQSALKVAAGYIPLAVLPDFYAYDKMATQLYPHINFTYLDATILQPDPVAILNRTGTHTSEAKTFLNYLLTEQAQNIIGKYRLPIHENATVSPPRINPFDASFPYVQGYNKTFQEIGKEIVRDYYRMWITERHESIKTAWNEIKEANKTKEVNENATRYYNIAWKNFTYAGYQTNRTQIDTLYNETKGWTEEEKVTEYMAEWWAKSSKAYSDAFKYAKKSKEAAE